MSNSSWLICGLELVQHLHVYRQYSSANEIDLEGAVFN